MPANWSAAPLMLCHLTAEPAIQVCGGWYARIKLQIIYPLKSKERAEEEAAVDDSTSGAFGEIQKGNGRMEAHLLSLMSA